MLFLTRDAMLEYAVALYLSVRLSSHCLSKWTNLLLRKNTLW